MPNKLVDTSHAYNFVSGENTVFYDDFSRYKDGERPSRWTIINAPQKGRVFATKAFVTTKDSLRVLYFANGNGRLAKPGWSPGAYLSRKNDYWSLEFDFKFLVVPGETCNAIGIAICSTPDYPEFIATLDIESSSNKCGFELLNSKREILKSNYPGEFNKGAWHHFAISFSRQYVSAYLDQYKFLKTANSDYYLPDMEIFGRAKVAIKNFKIATTDSLHPQKKPVATKQVSFTDTLLKEKRIVTHAITFDRSRAEIKPNSLPFIIQLADFLKKYPSLKLQIDGHTDSDVGNVDNMQLSFNRAEAIKRKLIALGIDGNRIQIKGFGPTRPIDTNSTPEGKAINRRVEFSIL